MTNINLIPVKNSMADELINLEFEAIEPCAKCGDCPHYESTYTPAKLNCAPEDAYPAEGEEICNDGYMTCWRAEEAHKDNSRLFDEVWWQNLEYIDPKLLAFAIHGNDGDLRDVVRVIWKDLEL